MLARSVPGSLAAWNSGNRGIAGKARSYNSL